LVEILLSEFRTTTPQTILKMKNYVTTGDLDGLRIEAHALKSASLTLDAHKLGRLFEDLEKATGTDSNLSKTLLEIEDEYPRSVAQIEQRIEILKEQQKPITGEKVA
jgi:HPt (histidine-containing phosphotransfer) domain-containing protein